MSPNLKQVIQDLIGQATINAISIEKATEQIHLTYTDRYELKEKTDEL